MQELCLLLFTIFSRICRKMKRNTGKVWTTKKKNDTGNFLLHLPDYKMYNPHLICGIIKRALKASHIQCSLVTCIFRVPIHILSFITHLRPINFFCQLQETQNHMHCHTLSAQSTTMGIFLYHVFSTYLIFKIITFSLKSWKISAEIVLEKF